MKRIYIITCILLSTLIVTTSCNPEDKFLNPEKTTEGNISLLFTGMLNNARFRTEYYQVRTMAAEHTGRYTQTLILPNSAGQYRQIESYVGHYWRDFYTTEYGGPMGIYRLMETVNKGLSSEDQAANDIFFKASKIVLYDYASGLIDMFGDIPFAEAGSLPINNEINPAKFENQQALYKTMIDELDVLATYFATAVATPAFTKQDILIGGKVTKWRQYANSLRLRMLIHMSYSDEAYAKEKIMAILNDASKYPLIDGDNNPNYKPETSDVLNAPLTTFTDALTQALNEGLSKIAPDYMVNKLLVPTKDPRLSVMFDKNDLPDYIGMPINTPGDSQSASSSDYSCWDSTTVWMNKNLPGVRLTASEVNFIKAEAQQRWGDPAKAKAAYETAVKQSVTFYYYLNQLNNNSSGGGFRIEDKPSDDEINKFVTERITYAGTLDQRLELIGTQKWLHFGWLQSIECWTEYRRTKYPKLLAFPSVGMDAGYTQPPTRLRYPSAETAYNPNYADVQAQDTRDTKIFWDVK